jgi:hypothetical protein
MDFVSIERGDESGFILNTAHESFMLERDESLAHHGPDIHLLCNLALHDAGSGLSLPEKNASFKAAATLR